jgi:iron complex transport system substrate-binding protein
LPRNRGSGEDIVRLDADLVLTGPYDSRTTRALLAARDLPFEIVAPWEDFESGETSLRRLAAIIGHPERAEALIGAIEAARIRARALVPTRATSLVLHRRGYVFHAGLTAAVAEAAGLVDAAPEVGVKGAGFVSLEALVAARPGYLIVSEADAGAEDQGQAFLQHPALRALWPPERRLVVPDRLTLCEGPATPALIEALAGEIRAKVQAAPIMPRP